MRDLNRGATATVVQISMGKPANTLIPRTRVRRRLIQWTRIDHVQLSLPPGAEEVARDCYGGLLGFEKVEKPESLQQNGGVWFRAGDIELHLGVEPATETLSRQHVASEVTSLEALRRVLETNEIAIQEESSIPGRVRFTFRDPFGNRIEVLKRTG